MRKLKKGRTKIMPKPTKVSSPDVKYYAGQGYIKASVDAKHKAVCLDVHKCCAFLDRTEAMTISLQLAHAGASLWGEQFYIDMELYLNTMRGEK